MSANGGIAGQACGCSSEECRKYGCQATPANRQRGDVTFAGEGTPARVGWLCPRCGSVHSPYVVICQCAVRGMAGGGDGVASG